MKIKRLHGVLLFAGLMCGSMLPVFGQQNGSAEGARTIHLKQNDAQVNYESKIYELKHASPEDVLPFVSSAILRYSRNSTIRRIEANGKDSTGALLVTTGKKFLPYVDEIVKALDYSGAKAKDGSVIQSTGLARIAYAPRYRAANEIADTINLTVSSSVGKVYVNPETNTIFWRDQADAAKRTLEWVKRLDRPLPQASIRINYYELRDSDLKDWGFDYLAWKNGPGVNLLNLGYNAGHLAIDQVLQQIPYVASASWSFGGFFTAPAFDMSFIRCLQQSGSASVTANASLTMINTPVRSQAEYELLKKAQSEDNAKAPFIYRISMVPEYQNISKNVLGRTVIGKSYYEDEEGEKHANPPHLSAMIINPFICFASTEKDQDKDGFIPEGPEWQKQRLALADNGGVIFQYSLEFKNAVERGNTGSELYNSSVVTGACTLAFGGEKVLDIYEKENDVEQTVGIPIVCRIPVIKYLFSTVTSIKERTYIVVTAEAALQHPDDTKAIDYKSESINIKRRIEKPLRSGTEE